MNKKGISLPIEMIVIVAIVVLVLVVVAAFFMGAFPAIERGVSDSAALATGCRAMTTVYNCAGDPSQVTIPGYKPPGYTADATLAVACARNKVPDTYCRRQCGCPS